MSGQIARRAFAEVAFQGVDITDAIRKHMLSMTFTDNENGEADDLQIRIADRENVWLEKWLGEAIEAAVSNPAMAVKEGSLYRVTASGGLNVRSGPGVNHSRIGGLAFGTQVSVLSVSNGWAAVKHGGSTAHVSAQYIAEVNQGADGEPAAPAPGFYIQARIVRENWNTDGKDLILDCGQFELDAVTAAGPPATVTIKGTSLPYGTGVRQTKKSRGWESCKLSRIAAEIAASGGMACVYESAHDPFYRRVEQRKTSDILFLKKLCDDAGISLKATNNILVLFDQSAYDARPAIFDIKRGDRKYTNWRLLSGNTNTNYTSCRVSYTDPGAGSKIEAIAYADDEKKEDKKNARRLEITAKVHSIGEAMKLARAQLLRHNRYALTSTFTLPGNPNLIAGLAVNLVDWGAWSGKHIINQTQHTVGNGGYATQIALRRALEG